ncbi:hypothetical protein HDV00_008500 [Rhizophlyctis rosea]|nr:hypothetical protein HDV00_008500 [Rhizophlyctis rosea]
MVDEEPPKDPKDLQSVADKDTPTDETSGTGQGQNTNSDLDEEDEDDIPPEQLETLLIALKDGNNVQLKSPIDADLSPYGVLPYPDCNRAFSKDIPDGLTDIKEYTKIGLELLEISSMNGHLDLVDYLLQEGTDPSANGHRVVMEHLAKYLIANGGGEATENKTFWRAIYAAAKHGHVPCLIRLLALVEVPDEEGERDEDMICTAVEASQLPVIEYLLEKAEEYGYNTEWVLTSVLTNAAEYGQLPVIQHVLGSQRPSSVDIPPDPEDTIEEYLDPIIAVAVRAGNADIVDYLLQNGAASNGADCLVAHGADVKLRGTEALEVAVRGGHSDVVWYLVEHCAESSYNCLSEAAATGYKDIVYCLLDKGEDITRYYGYEKGKLEGALVRAASRGHVMVLQYALERGLSPDVEVSTLRKVVLEGYGDAVECILRKTHHVAQEELNDILKEAAERWYEEANYEEQENLVVCLKYVLIARADAKAIEVGYEALKDVPYLCDSPDPATAYRVIANEAVANRLKELLENPELNVHVYRDAKCLISGKDYKVGFMQGLFRSKVILLLCSNAAICNVSTAHLWVDNMLLEWEHALQLAKINKAIVVPIFVGDEWGKPFDFSREPLDDYPKFLHPHHLSPLRETIHATMETIFGLQGKFLNPRDEKDYARLAGELIPLLEMETREESKALPCQDWKEVLYHQLRSMDLPTCLRTRDEMQSLMAVVERQIASLKGVGDEDSDSEEMTKEE